MSAVFTWAEEAEKLARPIIEQHHGHLKNARILYVFTDEEMNPNNRRILAKARKLSGLQQFLSLASDEDGGVFGQRPANFMILISEPYWEDMEEKTKVALLDHELCHFCRRDDAWAMRDHDVEEFSEIIKRHGLWKRDLEAFGREIQQLSLPLFQGAER